jgi:signal transduction histidine kinase
MNNNSQQRLELFSLLAHAGARREQLTESLEQALRSLCQLLSLEAIGLYLPEGDSFKLVTSAATSSDADQRLQLAEQRIFSNLRDRALESAYLTFGGTQPFQAFSLPLWRGNDLIGAAVGLQQGRGKLVSEDLFLEGITSALAIVLALHSSPSTTAESNAIPADVDKARRTVAAEMAVTVNHEINNPLTAILGNVQLMMLRSNELSAETIAKLQTIELSAMRIRDVTQKMMNLREVRSIPYADGSTMIDLDAGQTDQS